jgi:hypothetical protein
MHRLPPQSGTGGTSLAGILNLKRQIIAPPAESLASSGDDGEVPAGPAGPGEPTDSGGGGGCGGPDGCLQ